MIEFKRLTKDVVEKIRDIDRAEHVTTFYRYESGSLIGQTVDWHDPGWSDSGDEHSFQHIIDHTTKLLEAGGTFLEALDNYRLVGFAVFRPHPALYFLEPEDIHMVKPL